MRRTEAGHDANGSLPFHEAAASQAERIAAISGAVAALRRREPRRGFAPLKLAMLWIERIQFAKSSRGESVFSKPWDLIAEECLCGTSTIRELLATAADYGLVVIREARYCTGGQRPNEITIDVSACLRLATGRAIADRVPESGTPVPESGTPVPESGTPVPESGTPYRNTCFSPAQKPAVPPPPTPATATVATSRDDTGRIRWTREEEEEVDRSLFDVGFASRKSLIRRCQVRRLASTAVLDAIATYSANRGRLKGPGSIASWVETGIWPNPEVLPPAEAQEVAAAADDRATGARHQRIVDEAFRRVRRQTPIGTPVDEDQVIRLAVASGVPHPVVRRLRGLVAV